MLLHRTSPSNEDRLCLNFYCAQLELDLRDIVVAKINFDLRMILLLPLRTKIKYFIESKLINRKIATWCAAAVINAGSKAEKVVDGKLVEMLVADETDELEVVAGCCRIFACTT